MEWVILILMGFFVFVALFGFYSYLNKKNRTNSTQTNPVNENQLRSLNEKKTLQFSLKGTEEYYNALIKKYGAIKKGVNPTRDIDMPKRSSDGTSPISGVQIDQTSDIQSPEDNSRPFACFDSPNELTVKQARDRVNQYPLPMAWYKFYVYFRFPIGFLYSIIGFLIIYYTYNVSYYDGTNFYKLTMPDIMGFAIIVEVVFLIFSIIVFVMMLKLSQKAYEWNLASLIGDVIYGALFSVTKAGISMPEATPFMYIVGFLFSALIASLVWFLPNFIYFRKRKSLFHPEFDTSSKTSIKAIKKADKNAFEYNAKLYDRKSFVKLMAYEVCTQLDEKKIIEQINYLKEECTRSQSPQRCQAMIEAYSIAYQLKHNRLLTFDEVYDKMH